MTHINLPATGCPRKGEPGIDSGKCGAQSSTMHSEHPPPEAAQPAGVLRIGALRLCLLTHYLIGPLGSTRLTRTEAALLRVLARHEGAVPRELLYPAVFRREWNPRDRSLDVHATHLRHKLQSAGADTTLITAQRGQGYRLNAPAVFEPAPA